MGEKTLVIMAAGMGSRYGGLKQLDHVGPSGETIIDYSVYDALRAGFNKVVFIIKKENEPLVREAIGDRTARSAEVSYVFQNLETLPAGFSVPAGRTKPWGTGHAVMSCLGTVHGPFAVINADDFYGAEAFGLLSRWMDTASAAAMPQEYCMVGYRLENTLTENGTVSRGVCELEGRLLKSITERTKIGRRNGQTAYTEDGETWVPLNAGSTVSMNCWGFTEPFLEEARAGFKSFLKNGGTENPKAEFYLPSIVQNMMETGRCRVTVLSTAEQWFGVTYRSDKETVVREIAKKVVAGIYPANLKETV